MMDPRSLQERIEAQGGTAMRSVTDRGVKYAMTDAAGNVVATTISGGWKWVKMMEAGK